MTKSFAARAARFAALLGTALTPLPLLLATPAFAQAVETSGGDGGGPQGGAGGTSNASAPGGAGTSGAPLGGGGGGGAGTDGGAGGSGFGTGGTGGVGPGGTGAAGADNSTSAGGGGGGAHGYINATVPTTGANGGSGGKGGDATEYAGGGGAGGYGAVVTGGGDLGTLSVAISGGAGGRGGSAGLRAGSGGQGGHGLVLTAPSTLTVAAAVNGGNGGQAGLAGAIDGSGDGNNGLGGYGIVGGDLTLLIDAAVSGGLNGDGITRAFSLYFTGGGNTLVFGANGSLTGNVALNGSSLFMGGDYDSGGFDIEILSGSNALSLAEGRAYSGHIYVGEGTYLDLSGENILTGGISVAGTLHLAWGNAAGGAGNTITTLGSIISYADGIDVTTPIILDSDSTQLQVDGFDSAWQSGAISETGGSRPLEKTGTGTLVLGGANTYTGGTTVSGGLLGFYGDENLGTGTITLNGGGLRWEAGNTTDISGRLNPIGESGTFDTNGNDVTLASVISGTGTITKAGPGTLALTNTNTYEGGTTITGGLVNFASGDNFGTGNITLNGGGLQWAAGSTFDISSRLNDLGIYGGVFDTNGNDVTLASIIGGSGGLTKIGAGTLILSAANTYTGGTSIYGGVVNFAAGNNLGTGSITLDNGGTLQWAAGNTLDISDRLAEIGGGGAVFDIGANDVTFGTSLTGLGGITKVGSGTLTLAADSFYSGGTTITEGTLQVGNGGTGGTLGFGETLNNGNLVFNRLDTSTVMSSIGGTGSLVQEGSGTLILRGFNTYSGTTTINNGTLQVGTLELDEFNEPQFGGTLGTGDVYFGSSQSSEGGPSLVFANLSDYTFGGAIIGNGLVRIASDPLATITLAGSNISGNSFAGSVQIDSGRLNIAGDFGDVDNFAASLFMNGPDASLGGSGTFYGNIDLSTGTLAPGSSPGTLTIAGNLTLGAGTVLNFELSQPGVVGSNINDYVVVGGNLTLDGTLNTIAFGPNYGPGYYRLFTYGGALTDNGLNFGSIAGGFSAQILLNTPGQVNLLLGSAGAQTIQYWDGFDMFGNSLAPTGDGGNGIWNSTNTNWTVPPGYAFNDAWHSMIGVFAGVAGGVAAIEGVQSFQELRFETDGYALNAVDSTVDGLATMGGFSIIDVSSGIDPFTAFISAPISGSGGLTKTGTGTLVLAGTNTYSGVTTVSGGTLQVDVAGSLAGAVDNSATFINDGFVAGSLTNSGTAINNVTLFQNVTNSGTFTNVGGVAGTLFNNASASNSGTIGAGVSNTGTFTTTGIVGFGAVNNAGATFNASGQINGTFTNNGTFNVTGALTGISLLNQAATGTTSLNGNALTIATLLGAGAINFGSGPGLTTGSSNISSTFAGVIAGTGQLTKVGTGTLILSGNNTYTGGTLISGGTLQLGNGGTSGAIVGVIQDNGILAINSSDALTLSGVISGSGLVQQAGSGTTTLTGANTYSGGTLVSAGRLRGDTVSLQGNIQANTGATLEFAQATTGTFAGRLLGAGAVEKTGAGLLTYTGDNSLLTGPTRVLGGELRVNSLLSQSVVTVGSGATLSGIGTVGGIVAQSGSSVAPGNAAIGTLSVNGNMQFLAGSTYAAQVQATANDMLLGNGTAQLAGTLALTNLGGTYAFNTAYTLLQASGGRSGTFTTVTGLNTFGQAFAPQIVYTGTQALLLLSPQQLVVIAGAAGTPNQRNTLTRIDAAVAAGYNPQPLMALYSLAPPAAFLAGADALSGEIYPTSTRIALDDERLVRDATLQRLRLAGDAGYSLGTEAWGHAVGSWGTGDSDGNAARYERTELGFIAGVDHGGAFAGGTYRVGLAGHYISTDIDVADRGSGSDIDRLGFGAYAGVASGAFRLRVGAAFATLDLEAERAATFTGFAETLSGQTEGETMQGFAEIGYHIPAGGTAYVEPFVQFSIATVDLEQVRETGGASALNVREESDDMTTFTLGARGGFAIGGFRIDAALGAHHSSGDRLVSSPIALNAFTAQAFDIFAAPVDGWAATGNLDAVFDIGPSVTATVGYSGVVSDNARDHAVRGGLHVAF